MSKTTFIQFGDLHLERGNLDISVAPIRRIAEIAEERRPDLAIFTGDAVTRRGAFHPEAAFEFRSAMDRIQVAARLTVAIDGNHDVSFDGSKSFVVGALAEIDGRTFGGVRIVSGSPEIIRHGTGTPRIVAIPTFDRFMMKRAVDEAAASGDQWTPEGLVGAAVRGLIAEAMVDGDPVIVVYHGSLAGARLGNEQIIRAGIDVPVDPAAFVGASAVLLGHIHKPQELRGPDGIPMIYNGATCPLDWGEKAIEPSVVFGSIDNVTGAVEYERIPLPVVSDMIERRVKIGDPGTKLVLEAIIAGADLDTVPPGSRVRIILEAPGAVLDAIPENAEELLAGRANNARNLTIIRERTDATRRVATVDRRASIVDALRAWIAEQPSMMEEGVHDGLLALAQEIEGEVVDEDLDAAFDFRPRRLRVWNWCQYDEAELEFDGLRGVTMIRGQNTAGKSNLARAIPFALYKVQRAGDVLSDLIRNGQDRAELELEFEARGETYRIRRTMKRGKDRGASSVLFFERFAAEAQIDGGDLWRTVVEGTEPETQAKIAEIVGPADLFFSAAYADQDAIASILKLRPAEMKDLLAQVLHRDFASRVERVRRRRARAEDARAKAAAVLEDLSRNAEALAPAEAELRALGERRAALQRDLEGLGVDDLLTERVERGVADVARLREEAKASEGATRELAAVHTKLADLRRDLGHAEAAAARVEAAAESVIVLGKRRDELQGLERERDGLQEQERARRSELEAARRATADAQRVHRERAAENDRQTVSRARKIEDLERREREAQEVAGLVDRVPCGGETVFSAQAFGNPIECGDCPLISQAVARRAALPEIRRELEAARAAALDWTRSSLEAEQPLLEAVAAAETAERRAAEALEPIAGSLELVGRRLTEIRQEVAILEAAERRFLEDRPRAESLPRLRQELEQETARADRLVVAVAAGDVAVRIAVAERELEDARRALAEVQGRRRAIDQSLATLAGSIAKLEATVDMIRGQEARRSELQTALWDREREIMIFSTYEQALGRDGVPFLLLELYAIPEIRDRVNHYLEPTPFRVEIETERRAVTAGVKPGVYVSFVDGRGRHPLSAASGFQSVAIGSALRQAVSDLHGSATGTRIRLSVQDEGFGAYDSENLKGAVETIRRISEEREVFMFVSHIEGMDSIADHVLTVVPGERGSTVELDQEVKS